MKVTGCVLTILFGAGPATFMSFIAALGFYFGITAVLDGDMGSLLFVVWGGAGLYGTAALWAAGFGWVRPWVAGGLVAGTLALVPFLGSIAPLFGSFSVAALLDIVFLLGPLMVAFSWLAVLTAGAGLSDAEKEAT